MIRFRNFTGLHFSPKIRIFIILKYVNNIQFNFNLTQKEIVIQFL